MTSLAGASREPRAMSWGLARRNEGTRLMVPQAWQKHTIQYTSACEEKIDGHSIPGLPRTVLQVPEAHNEHVRPTEQHEGESHVAVRVAWCWGQVCGTRCSEGDCNCGIALHRMEK